MTSLNYSQSNLLHKQRENWFKQNQNKHYIVTEKTNQTSKSEFIPNLIKCTALLQFENRPSASEVSQYVTSTAKESTEVISRLFVGRQVFSYQG